MLNRYTLFSAVYRYTSQFEQLVDNKIIEKEFYETDLAHDVATQALMKKSLEHNYDVFDEESCLATLNDYIGNRYFAHPFFSVLVDIWREKRELVLPSGNSLDSIGISDEYLLQVIKLYSTDFSENDEGFVLECLKDQLLGVLSADDGIETFFLFFDQYALLVELAAPYVMWGFDLGRVMDLLVKSHNVGYLSDEQLTHHMNEIGQCIEGKFNSWEQFYASSILGKLYMTHERDVKSVSIMNKEDFIKSIYGLITSPNKILLNSGIWEKSDCEILKTSIQDIFHIHPAFNKEYLMEHGANAQLEKQSISLFAQHVLHPLEEKGVGKYLTDDWELNRLYYADIDIDTGVWFWERVKKTKDKFELFFSKEEIPLLVLGNAVLTSKALYLIKRRFFKKNLIKIPLEQVVFDFTIDFTQTFMEMSANGVKLASLILDPTYVGKTTKDELTALSKDEVENLYRHDMDVLKDVFNALGCPKN